MGKDNKATAAATAIAATGGPPENYGQVVERLETVVRRLEGGELSLEDSLKEFEEGIRLVRRGEGLLGDAERRVEELLAEGAGDRAVPFVPGQEGTRASGAEGGLERASKRAISSSGASEEDVPF